MESYEERFLLPLENHADDSSEVMLLVVVFDDRDRVISEYYDILELLDSYIMRYGTELITVIQATLNQFSRGRGERSRCSCNLCFKARLYVD